MLSNVESMLSILNNYYKIYIDNSNISLQQFLIYLKNTFYKNIFTNYIHNIKYSVITYNYITYKYDIYIDIIKSNHKYDLILTTPHFNNLIHTESYNNVNDMFHYLQKYNQLMLKTYIEHISK